MTIFDVGADPQAIAAVVDRTVETIRSTGGNPGNVDRWGRRPFAYEVNHKREGYYVLLEFTADPPTVSGLDRMLALADEVVRHKVIRLPDNVAGRARPAVQAPQADKGAVREKPAPTAAADTAANATEPGEEPGTEDASTDAPAPVG
jgi:small subunit ribosomal protein S6